MLPYQISRSAQQNERDQRWRKTRPTETTETERNGIKFVENADENRIQLIFDGKPPAAVRGILKSNGFRWSPYNTAWQRNLNAAGRHAASYALDRIEALN